MIRLQRVHKKFGRQSVLSDVSFELASGEHLVVAGPSGCGKTTLLRIVAGLEDVDAGTVWLDDAEASTPAFTLAPHLRSIGFAFQAPALWPHMTVRAHLEFAAGSRIETDDVKELVRGLGLEALLHKVPHQLSGGESRRVALARAMVSKPSRLLLDEAFSHLDEDGKNRLLEFVIDRANRSGTSLIFVSHDTSEVGKIPGRTLQFPWVGK